MILYSPWTVLMVLVLVITGYTASPCVAGELLLPGYQSYDGAITVHFHGDRVDPYFATKALLVAHQAGLDIKTASMRWIDWALQHQRADGSFNRFCRQGERYVSCAPADADDAVLAVWIELLAKLAPPTGLPPTWADSLRRAESYLTTLYDRPTGIYVVSKSFYIGLFMDNVEVYSALKAASQLYLRVGNRTQAKRVAQQANQLQDDIVRTFWHPHLQRFRVSTQGQATPGFYPDQVAQLFPILADMPTPHQNNGALFATWMDANRALWWQHAYVDYPWGLMALAAEKMGDHKTVACWYALVSPLRHGAHWNVLEEALYQAFGTRTSAPERALSQTCGNGKQP